MGKVIVQDFTCKEPITMIGTEAGVCWGADISDQKKNYRRGIDCLESEHGRTFEFPDAYMILDGYSARVIREWYTHIGGSPTRLQASTRYIDYEHGFDYVVPPSIEKDEAASAGYKKVMTILQNALTALDAFGVPREDTALLLPLGMTTRIVCKHNARNLMDKLEEKGIAYTENNTVDEMLSLGIVQVPVLSVDGELLDFQTANQWVNQH